ncbi:hypothetical protein D0839_16400 [Bordetella avium]|uniref:hypothetical protein n=1 Tax=Bordetella avium TaxID=521 RepID=UPI000E6A5B91|nr:hypothetical protein [Bordetella avium]RIQ65873.1 hypothetical protein D0839_16400 [Bordetella avium]
MAFDEMFADDLRRAVANRAQLPPIAPQPERGFSFWGTLTALPRGVGAGVVGVGATWMDMAGAFGTVTAAYGTTGVMPFAETDEQRAWREQGAAAARKKIEDGDGYSTDWGDDLRRVSRWMGPNPETAGFAEQTVFNFSRMVTKAVGYSVATGNPATGALLTGVDEGVTVSDELRREGVDTQTRTKIGALAGVATGVGVALPVAGSGIKSTAALIAAGGPGLFIAQNQLSRDILQNANYDQQAMQYDPFDPVGLAVSTLLPAAFGGWALRARSRSAKGDAPGKDAGQPNVAHDSEVADAARVNAVRELVDSWKLEDPGNVRAANDALLSVMRAADQLASGSHVSVLDSIPISEAQGALALERMIARSEAERAALLSEADRVAERGSISAMRSEIAGLSERARASDEAAVKELARQLKSDNPRLSYKQALSEAKRQADQVSSEAMAAIARLEDAIDANANAVEAQRALKILDAKIAAMKAERAAISAPATEATAIAGAVRQMMGEQGAASRQDRTPRAGQTGQQSQRADQQPRPTSPEQVATRSTGSSEGATASPAKLSPATVQAAAEGAVAGRIAELATNRPDALVRLDGIEGDIPLTEALRLLDERASQAIADADLLRVAATCAIGAI